MQELLLEMVRQRVRNGELTESRLARLTGVSQPHIHNVLKGVRILSTELADEILRQLSVNTGDLFSLHMNQQAMAFRRVPLLAGTLGPGMEDYCPTRVAGTTFVPFHLAAALREPLAARLAEDPASAPRFEKGDLVLIDQSADARTRIEKSAAYIVVTASGPRLRYIRQGGARVYFPCEQSVRNPAKWDSIRLNPPDMLEIVRGRIVWVSRQLETESEQPA